MRVVLYCAGLGAVLVGAAVALYATLVAGAAIAAVGMFVAGATDPTPNVCDGEG